LTTGSALPTFPQSVSRGRRISWLHWFASATACQVARPPVRIRLERPALGDFYFQAFNGSVSLPVAGYDYNSDWTLLLAGLSPAGMAASLAARSKAVHLFSASMSPFASCGHSPRQDHPRCPGRRKTGASPNGKAGGCVGDAWTNSPRSPTIGGACRCGHDGPQESSQRVSLPHRTHRRARHAQGRAFQSRAKTVSGRRFAC
jgi:hypothetical protein